MNTVMVPSTTFASARAQARSHDDSLSFVPCVCVAVAMVTLVSGPGSIINQAGPRQPRVASVKCNQSKYTGHRDHWHTGTRCGAQLMAAFTPQYLSPCNYCGHSPVDDGEEVDDPEAGPEHEVGGGGGVEEQQQGEGHGGCCRHSARAATGDRGHCGPPHTGGRDTEAAVVWNNAD